MDTRGLPPLGSDVEVNTGIGYYDALYEWIYEHLAIFGVDAFSFLWSTWKGFVAILTLVLLTAVTYSIIRYNQLRDAQKARLKELTVAGLSTEGDVEHVVNERWQKILEHSESSSEGDWRQAILEADILLDEMMHAMGYTYETLGEKLKSVEKSDFASIDKAWEAHKIRNRIAHDGSLFHLSHREVRRVIDLYRQVFEEFHYL